VVEVVNILVSVRAILSQHFDDGEIIRLDSQEQRHVSMNVLGLHVRALLQQRHGHL
jgi:hypothetical protein